MSVPELSALPVWDLAADNCALCMWATRPKMREALTVMRAWGFEYITELFTWVKLNPSWSSYPVFLDDVYAGLGHYTRANTEGLLLGRRGRLTVQDNTVRQVIHAARGRHSAKPAVARKRIVSLFGDVPRIELFARESVDGWDVWGNDASLPSVE
jgi:N6-adenosine-specific RNA methylase IME4